MLGSFRDRLADMVKANVYDLLELAELLPDQSASDLENSDRFARDQLGAQIARRHTVSATIPVMETALTEAREKARQAVEKDKDDLARLAISTQLDIEKRLNEARRELEGLTQSITTLEALLAKLSAARQS